MAEPYPGRQIHFDFFVLTTSKKSVIISFVKIKMLNFLIFALIYNVNIMKDGETNIDSKESWGEYLKKIRDAHPESDS